MERKELAKQIKIQDIFEGELKARGNKLHGFCPFHSDKQLPNFFIFLDTNTWCCFAGCGAGDVISFYMKLTGCDFKTALKELIKRK